MSPLRHPSAEAGGDRRQLSSTATLALGTLGSGLYAAQDAAYSALRADLLNGAFSSPDGYGRSSFIHAIGNTGDASLSWEIVALLDDDEPAVRSAAAQSLGRLGTSEVADTQVLHLRQEKNSVVRGAIAAALVSWDHPSLAATESVQVAIRQERDENTRYEMARFLARNLAAFPDNRVVLQDLLHSEQSRRIREHVTEVLVAVK